MPEQVPPGEYIVKLQGPEVYCVATRTACFINRCIAEKMFDVSLLASGNVACIALNAVEC